MRHIFDQYGHPENRLTHALVSCLREDSTLLCQFVNWATGEPPPTPRLEIVEQTCPGEQEPQDESEAATRRGLPDGWVYDLDIGWGLIIESKIESALDRDQLKRHHSTAVGRGFTSIHLLALVTELSTRGHPDDPPVTVKKWSDLYGWLLQQKDREWARRLSSYIEVLEAKLVRNDYLKGGTLTVFAGIPFGKDEPYTYLNAKRLLRLAMDELRKRTGCGAS